MFDCVVKKPKTAIVIPRSLRRGISSIRYYYTFRFTKRSLAALGMTIRIFYESIMFGTEAFRRPSALRNGPRIRVRGDELLKKNAGWGRPDSGLYPIVLSVRPHSVIPGLTRNPCSSGRDGGNFPETFSRLKMDPGSGSGVTSC
jgi:hypothetical protein